jgi:hypothetical protein
MALKKPKTCSTLWEKENKGCTVESSQSQQTSLTKDGASGETLFRPLPMVWNMLGNDTAGGALPDLLRQTKHSHSSALI